MQKIRKAIQNILKPQWYNFKTNKNFDPHIQSSLNYKDLQKWLLEHYRRTDGQKVVKSNYQSHQYIPGQITLN